MNKNAVKRSQANPRGGNILFLVIGLIILAVGFFINFSASVNKKKCTEKVPATVVGILEKQSRTGSAGSRNRSTVTVYSPVFGFTYEGQKYKVNNSSYSNLNSFYEGQETEIYINPDDPNQFYCPEDKTSKSMTYVLALVGGVFTLVSVVSIIKAKSGKNAPTNTVYTDEYEQYMNSSHPDDNNMQ